MRCRLPLPASAPRSRRAWSLALLAVLAVASGASLWAWWLWRSEPAYWRAWQASHQQMRQADLSALAIGLETQVNYQVTHLPAHGSATQRIVRIPLDHANAWLATQLPRWLDNMGLVWPEGVEQPMLAVEADQLVLAFRLRTDQFDRVVSVLLRPTIDSAGDAHVSLTSLRIGQLPVPMGMVAAQLPQRLGTMLSPRTLAWTQGQAFTPVYPIDAARQVRITGLTLEPDHLQLDLDVQPRPR